MSFHQSKVIKIIENFIPSWGSSLYGESYLLKISSIIQNTTSHENYTSIQNVVTGTNYSNKKEGDIITLGWVELLVGAINRNEETVELTINTGGSFRRIYDINKNYINLSISSELPSKQYIFNVYSLSNNLIASYYFYHQNGIILSNYTGRDMFGENNCGSENNIEKNINVDLTNFDGQEILYQFIVTDIANNTDESKPTKVRGDTTAPVINSIKYTQNRGYINLDINITEKNFDKAEYYDLNNAKARWKNLCTSLREGICKKRIRFVGTSPNILIRVLDEAGNSNETEMII